MIPKWSDPEGITEETYRGGAVEIAGNRLKQLGCGYRRFKQRFALSSVCTRGSSLHVVSE